MIRYRLSNRQYKELMERATTLVVALPAPPFAVKDLVAWARDALPEVADCVRYTEEQELTVLVPQQRDDDPTLAKRIGAIVPEGQPVPEQLTVQVAAIVVTLEPPDRARHRTGKIQWAAECVEPRRP